MKIPESHKSYQGTVFANGKTFDLYLGHQGWEINQDGSSLPVTLEELNTRLENCEVMQRNPLMLCAVPKLGPFEVPVGTEPL